MQVTRFEDGLGVLLPDSMVNALKLHEGDEVEISVKPVAASDDEKRQSIEKHLIALRRFRGLLPQDFRFDREEANERR